jgi:hypothetical protein
MDHDSTPGNSDDFLGHLEVPISELAPGRSYDGWLPLLDNEAGELEALGATTLGGVNVVVTLDVKNEKSERWLSITGVPPTEEAPLPDFNLDKVYSPLMLILDLFWTRFVSQCISGVLETIQWTNPKVSAFWFVLCLFLALHPPYIPFAFWSLLAIWHRSKRPLPRPPSSSFKSAAQAVVAAERMKKSADAAKSQNPQSTNGHEVEEAHLSGFVSSVAMIAPRSLKETCRGLQPVLENVAGLLQMLHGTFTWAPTSTISMPFQCALWAIAFMHLVFPLHCILVVEVLVMFTVLTPAFTIILGSVNYMLKSAPKGIAGLQHEYNPDWHSSHALKKDSKRKCTKRPDA